MREHSVPVDAHCDFPEVALAGRVHRGELLDHRQGVLLPRQDIAGEHPMTPLALRAVGDREPCDGAHDLGAAERVHAQLVQATGDATR